MPIARRMLRRESPAGETQSQRGTKKPPWLNCDWVRCPTGAGPKEIRRGQPRLINVRAVRQSKFLGWNAIRTATATLTLEWQGSTQQFLPQWPPDQRLILSDGITSPTNRWDRQVEDGLGIVMGWFMGVGSAGELIKKEDIHECRWGYAWVVFGCTMHCSTMTE